MKRYKIQYAYPKEIGSPSVHTSEATARDEVAYLLGTWIWRSLKDVEENLSEFWPKELVQTLKRVLYEVKRLIGEGQVWDAFDLWEDFSVSFEKGEGRPIYSVMGTVIIEGSRATGLQNRIPLQEASDNPPGAQHARGPVVAFDRMHNLMDQVVEEVMEVAMRKAELKGIEITPEEFSKAVQGSARALPEYQMVDEESEREALAQFREGILRRLFPKPSGMGLGALKSWLVQYADFGGASHASRHTNEGRAKADAKEYLTRLLHHLEINVSTEAHVGRNPEYVKEAEDLVHYVHYLLDTDMVWAAYTVYKDFEAKWNYELGPFPLEVAIGTMRVIPTPESE